uniref:Dual specificity protein phosphatase diacylglycerol catalytic region n=1 Tax=Tetraselmis sp. GSL018 TaxID=582737 RepID=A0A061SJ91_9CHLO
MISKLSLVVASVASSVGVSTYIMRRCLPAPAVLLLGQTSVVGICVAIASSGRFSAQTTKLLGKMASGKFYWWSYPLFWPYHSGLTLKLWVQRKFSSEASFNQVAKSWYIGGWPQTEQDIPCGDVAVIDCTCELLRRHNRPYLCLPTWDCQGPAPSLIDEGVNWAIQQKSCGREVLVHCAHGHGRSCVVLCAILISQGLADTIDDALTIVRSTRERAKLNANQRRALVEWQNRISKKL